MCKERFLLVSVLKVHFKNQDMHTYQFDVCSHCQNKDSVASDWLLRSRNLSAPQVFDSNKCPPGQEKKSTEGRKQTHRVIIHVCQDAMATVHSRSDWS